MLASAYHDDELDEAAGLLPLKGQQSHMFPLKPISIQPVAPLPVYEGIAFNSALSSYWFGWSFLWLPLLVVVLPYQVEKLAGSAGKGAALGSTLLSGSFLSFFLAPMFGSLSDSCKHPWGRRRPWMAAGTVLSTIALLIMAVAPTIGVLQFGFLLLSAANNMIISPYSALLPDVVDHANRGTAAGFLGMFSMLGNLCGGLLSFGLNFIGLFATYCIMAFVHALSMWITCRFVHEHRLTEIRSPVGVWPRINSFIVPFFNRDWRVLFCTRFLLQMGILTVQEYLSWYLQDAVADKDATFSFNGVVVATSAQQAVSILFIPLLMGALVSSLAAGLLSDKFGGKRKVFVYFAGGVMGVACFVFAITRSFTTDFILFVLQTHISSSDLCLFLFIAAPLSLDSVSVLSVALSGHLPQTVFHRHMNSPRIWVSGRLHW